MNFETLKSVILVILIMFSLLLTVALWNYQPESERIEDDNYVEDSELAGAEAQLSDIIEPSQIIFHDSSSYTAYEENNEDAGVYELMRDWTIYDLQTPQSQQNTEEEDDDAPAYPEANEMVELAFSTPLPAQVISDIFSLEGEGSYTTSARFDRLFFIIDDANSEIEVRFISTSGDRVMSGFLRNESDIEKLTDEFDNQANKQPMYLFQQDWERRIFLPFDNVEVPIEVVSLNRFPFLPLKNVLFPDPFVVRESQTSSGSQRLSDSFRSVNISKDGKLMEFVNPIDGYSTMNTYEVLTDSINFVNDHRGWTDTYNIMDLSGSENTITYQMYYNQLPIYNGAGLASIDIRYAEEQVAGYNRPLVELESQFPADEREMDTLASGEDLEFFIQQSRRFSTDNIEDINVGYTLTPREEGLDVVYELSPSWFVKVNGSWQQVDTDEKS
ncbi:YycH family regulatory protein [Thalassobacillus sp. CUG 92003]|uniref:YycH family regulatory protein n=1 Tax=Thalassobacillus sp. CUG 92003 TaxID=2736641 RepID=UPI0015E6FA89|nr:two-component system activity regulator YycH [Thalassobacillus sp. CUG 92003]